MNYLELVNNSISFIEDNNESIINIAMNFGYDYPEVFSRAFKKHFGISPAYYRKSSMQIIIKKPEIINKDIVNINGTLSLKGKVTYLEDINLKGISTSTNINTPGFFNRLEDIHNSLESNNCYHIITCLGDGENFNIFYGFKDNENRYNYKESKRISSGWFISFKYRGNMDSIYKHLRSDIESTFKTLKIPLAVSGIGMFFNIDKSKPEDFKVFVPILRKEVNLKTT